MQKVSQELKWRAGGATGKEQDRKIGVMMKETKELKLFF